MALPYDPNFTMSVNYRHTEREHDPEHDSSASAAVVAVHLISSARLALELDSEYTEYSAQYLVDSHGQGGITVKDCLKFALDKGIPKARNWTHLGSVLKPPLSFKPALISMKGDVIEIEKLQEVHEWVKHQPVGAKLHVFTPHIDVAGDGIYGGPSGDESRYVGLRDAIIVGTKKIQGKAYATVKIWYKKKFKYVTVALGRAFMNTSVGVTKPTGLLVDFVVPRLSIS